MLGIGMLSNFEFEDINNTIIYKDIINASTDSRDRILESDSTPRERRKNRLQQIDLINPCIALHLLKGKCVVGNYLTQNFI